MADLTSSCPHCGVAMLGSSCPTCSALVPHSADFVSQPLASEKTRRPPIVAKDWVKFFGIFLAAPLLTAAIASVDARSGIAIPLGLLGSVGVGLYSGFWLSYRFLNGDGARLICGFCFAIVLFVVNLCLCFAGCGVAGGLVMH